MASWVATATAALGVMLSGAYVAQQAPAAGGVTTALGGVLLVGVLALVIADLRQ